jgi:hypothetical protein
LASADCPSEISAINTKTAGLTYPAISPLSFHSVIGIAGPAIQAEAERHRTQPATELETGRPTYGFDAATV